MPTPPIRDWARRLIASEAVADTTSRRTELATVRVYERLRRQLCAPVGVDGFKALAARALALAKSESPRLGAVQITASGGLRGLGEAEPQADLNQAGTDQDEAGTVLIAQLLGLFLKFLGEATTLRLMEDVRRQGEIEIELNATGTGIAKAGSGEATAESGEATTRPSDATTGANYFGPYDDILLEADRLRNVSERLETLAANHAGMEQGLVSVAGNIRNIATVLDVFTMVRSKAGGPQKDSPKAQTNGYVN